MIAGNSEIESYARACATRHGRGIIVAAVDGNMAELIFIPLESWNADPLPACAGDPYLAAWLSSYDLTREYVLLEAVRRGEEMIIQPFLIIYSQVEHNEAVATI
jgi:hypothetical protein